MSHPKIFVYPLIMVINEGHVLVRLGSSFFPTIILMSGLFEPTQINFYKNNKKPWQRNYDRKTR